VRERYGRHFRTLGFSGFAVLLLAFTLTGYALANGVPCPECDSHHLTSADFAFWKRYFLAKDGVYLAATLLLAVASPWAAPRRWPFVFGLALALFSLALTPR
jgi:hypothetical protein